VTAQIAVLASIQVGTPHRYGVEGAPRAIDRAWATSFFREPNPAFTVALVNDFGHGCGGDETVARALAACPLLNEWWRDLVLRRAGDEAV
jgi:hypothetical protein